MNKNILIAIASAIFTAIILLGGFIWWQSSQEKNDVVIQNNQIADSLNSASGENNKNIDSDGLNNLQSSENDVNNDKQDSQEIMYTDDSKKIKNIKAIIYARGKKVNISLAAPVEWGGIVTRPDYTILDGKDLLAQVSFKDNYGKGESSIANNKLTIYDITEWLVRDDGEGPGAYSSIDKKKMVDELFSARKNKNIYSSSSSRNCPFNIARAISKTVDYIETIDGKFSGCFVATTSPQDPAYDPHLDIEMIGKINDRYIYIEGRFKLNDKFVKEMEKYAGGDFKNYLKRLKEIMKDIEKNGLPAESQQEMNEVKKVITTLKIEQEN